jgi:hypothetical protein
MLETRLHAPSGLLPSWRVRRRTVVDLQPGLLAVLAGMVGLALLRRRPATPGSRRSEPTLVPARDGLAGEVYSTPPGTSPREVHDIRDAAAQAGGTPLP